MHTGCVVMNKDDMLRKTSNHSSPTRERRSHSEDDALATAVVVVGGAAAAFGLACLVMGPANTLIFMKYLVDKIFPSS